MALRHRETDATEDSVPVEEQGLELTNEQRITGQPVSQTHNELTALSAEEAALARWLVAQHRAVYDYLADR
jgi:stress-induced morphogen